MTINLNANPAFQYVGIPISLPMQMASANARAVALSFNWAAYGGATIPNITVNCNLQSGSNTPAPLLDKIRSIYIDNLASPVPIYIQFPDTGFTVTAQAYSDGWYPVFSNAFIFSVGIFGLTATNLSTSNIFVTNVLSQAFSDVALQQSLGLNLASPTLGGGSSIISILPNPLGAGYSNGNMSINGGGGNGAAAHGILDAYGRFTAVIIDNGGVAFTGQPIILATGPNPGPAAYNPATEYFAGNIVCFSGTQWICNVNGTGSGQPPGYPGFWSNSGIPCTSNAAFMAVLGAPATPLTTSGYGLSAAGDQAGNFVDSIVGTGVFRNNLFGTPFGVGFLYITNIEVDVWKYGAGTIWEMVNSNGYAPYVFEPGQIGPQLNMGGMNQKLDATLTWRLNCTNFGANIISSHAFAWTYSLQ